MRFTAPDGQACCAEQDGDWFAFWLEGQEDRWEASEHKFVVGTVASTLGFSAHEEPPGWIDDLAATVLAALHQDA